MDFFQRNGMAIALGAVIIVQAGVILALADQLESFRSRATVVEAELSALRRELNVATIKGGE